MLNFDPEAYSLRWYSDIFRNGMAAPDEPLDWACLLTLGITANGLGYPQQLFYRHLRDIIVNCAWHSGSDWPQPS